jgi:hypothetical protein
MLWKSRSDHSYDAWVEEVDSGKSQRFASVEEFLSFLQRCLGDQKYVGR